MLSCLGKGSLSELTHCVAQGGRSQSLDVTGGLGSHPDLDDCPNLRNIWTTLRVCPMTLRTQEDGSANQRLQLTINAYLWQSLSVGCGTLVPGVLPAASAGSLRSGCFRGSCAHPSQFLPEATMPSTEKAPHVSHKLSWPVVHTLSP